MPKGKYLTEYERGLIDGLRSQNKTYREIALIIGRGSTVVHNYVKNRESYGKNHSGGRPPAMTATAKRQFLRDISNTGDSINKVMARNDVKASRSTCWRLANSDINLKYMKLKPRPKLKAIHIKARLEWAKKYMGWTYEWQKIIFSDEKKFNLDGPDGHKYYWHDLRKEERWFSKRVCGGGSVMVWAGIGFNGKTDLVVIDVKNNGDIYCETLQNNLFTFARRIAGNNWIFQHDNSSIHRSKVVKQWFEKKKVRVLDWPSLSPDLNIIENVWGDLVRMVYDNGKQYDTKNELKKAILDAWDDLGQDTIRKLFDSMPNRVYELIRKNGHKIQY